ncbi:hypothetical protein AB205_0095330 [Aquarana catesbeiana]|uniref:Uncharacterized protein n=1 Tax=Aquarana catesbeiana TaxID=8400 RepID=A0A2G9RK62_AQUCT|nr:hypothetical protein AB205_0095330 [Aquarana catesbeiana]
MSIYTDRLFFSLSCSPPGLSGSPVISDISLIRLSPHAVSAAEFGHAHHYVNPHMEHYLRSVHGSPTLSMISAARGLSPAEVAHEHLKERGIFGIAPPPPGVNPADYYHQMTLLASHPSPYGELLLQGGAVGAGGHLHDYLTPMDGKWLPNELYFWLFALFRSVKPNLRNVFEAILLVSSEHRCPQT